MISVACVEVGDYLQRGVEYVRRLRSMTARWLPEEHEFVVATDAPDRYAGIADRILRPPAEMRGWWAKLALFSPAAFPAGRRVLYLDLDTVVVGDLRRLAQAKGIIYLRDWGWRDDVYGSGAMVWDSGEHRVVWERWTPKVASMYRGDQDWITALRGWERLPPGLVLSYRYSCVGGPPAGCCAVAFHGRPKPHEISSGWVKDSWL